ncbi:MAG: hypothetical protein ACYDDB_04045 [bacterium]
MGLFKRKNSPYYFMKFQLNGRRIYESTKTANKKFAEDIYLTRRHEIMTGAAPERKFFRTDPAMTFRDLAERYLEFTSGRLKSHYNLKCFVKTLVDRFGDKQLDDFNIFDLEGLQNDIIGRFSAAYANRLVVITRIMFNKALDWELADEDVVKRLKKCKLLKGENKRLRYCPKKKPTRLYRTASLI